jgi:phage antirepressor YoqD-like protein
MLQIFNYNNDNVTFRNEYNVIYVNATEMAKPFGKRTNDYLSNQSTEEFVNALRFAGNVAHPYRVVNYGPNEERGTWMHEDVALDFAQWLSPTFRVWCNQRIKELVTTGKTEIQPLSNVEKIAEGYKLLMLEVETVKEQNKLLTKTVKEQATKVDYVNQVLLSDDAINPTVIAKELGMSAMALNKKLVEKRIIYKSGSTYVPYSRYQSEGYTKTRTHYFTRPDGSQGTQIHTYFTEKGRAFIHSLFKNAA